MVGLIFQSSGTCLAGGGGGITNPFLLSTDHQQKKLCGLGALTNSCRGKRDNDYMYVHYIVCFRFIWKQAQYLLSYIICCPTFVTKLILRIKVEIASGPIKYSAARERLNNGLSWVLHRLETEMAT